MIIAKTAVQKWGSKTNRKYSRKSRIAAWKQPLKGSHKDFSEPRLLCPNFKCKRKNSVWSRGPNTPNDASVNYLHSIVVTIAVLHLVWKVLQSVCTGVAVVSCVPGLACAKLAPWWESGRVWERPAADDVWLLFILPLIHVGPVESQRTPAATGSTVNPESCDRVAAVGCCTSLSVALSIRTARLYKG